MNPIRVLIVDDHAIVRQGIATFIEAQDDMQLVGEAENGCQALARAAELVPDVVLMDVLMPEMDGITATREIIARYPGIKILVLTCVVNPAQLVPVLQAGASGFLLKDISLDELMMAIRAACRGETPLASIVTEKLVEGIIADDAIAHALQQLTEREREVLSLLGCGLSNKDIAKQLSISDKTVKFHVSSVLGKLNLNDRTQAALFAVRVPHHYPD